MNLPTETILMDFGWQRLEGKWYYIFDGSYAPNGYRIQTGISLTVNGSLNAWQVGQDLLGAFELCSNQRTSATMVLFSLLGVLFKPFEEAGYPIRFLLFVNGKSGSMKTTIGKLLFNLQSKNGNRNTRRIDSDTITSIERAIVLTGVDSSTFVDDFAPQRTMRKKNELQNKLEYLIRMVEDGATKSRSNAMIEDIQGEGIGGVVTVAGEIRGTGLSSVLRCFYAYIERGEANVEMITRY